MKVAHIFKTYFPDTQGGLEEVIRQITTYTTSKGVKNTIYTVTQNSQELVIEYPEASIVRFKSNIDVASTPFSWELAKSFNRIIDAADILHFHFPWPFAELLYVLSTRRKPTIVTYHSDIVKQKRLKSLYQPFLNRFLNKADVIVPTSCNYMVSSRDLKPFYKKCTPIPLFLGKSRFEGSETDESAIVREKYGKEFFLFVGVLRYYKGLQYLIPAMKGITRNLVIVGKGPEQKRLEKLVKRHQLKNVHFAGYVPDQLLPSLYKECRAVVFPSCERSEAFGVTILEALNFGKPVVSTELGTGTSFANKHHETGLVVPPKDSDALLRALKVLSENDEVVTKFGKNSRARFEAKFSAAENGNKYLELYERLLH
jgi:glycosyltransferase involved in cell wall biosynthesis